MTQGDFYPIKKNETWCIISHLFIKFIGKKVKLKVEPKSGAQQSSRALMSFIDLISLAVLTPNNYIELLNALKAMGGTFNTKDNQGHTLLTALISQFPSLSQIKAGTINIGAVFWTQKKVY